MLSKFRHGQPSHRLLQDLASHGLIISAETMAGGLQKIAPLFEPINTALLAHLRSAQHWHADETRWATFVDVEGKVDHRWYLWVFHSPEVVHYVLDKSRAAHVIDAELDGVSTGRYGYSPLLLETFVEFERHRGTCYKAANWINVSGTSGRGKKSLSHKPLIPIKDVWFYPLHKQSLSALRR